MTSAPACPITPVVDLVFSRWTTPILWTLRDRGTLRFTELQRAIGDVTPKVLTQRLRQLERDGLVERTLYPAVPPRVEYAITELGDSLAPVFAALVRWSGRHLDDVGRAREDYDRQHAPDPELMRTAARLRDTGGAAPRRPRRDAGAH